MKRALAVAAAGLAMAAAPAPKVGDLAWLSGAWVSEAGGEWTEELWSAPRGGMMLGTNRSGKDDKAKGFEFIRIAADASGTVIFWGSPGGAAPVAFKLVSSGPGEAVFDNPAHDYPTRIIYRREGERLHARVEGAEGKNPLSWTFRRPEAR